jgi:hypothetical protein
MTQLLALLHSGGTTASSTTQDTMRSAIATGLVIVADIGDHIKRIIQNGAPGRRPSVTTAFRSFQTRLSLSSTWSEESVHDYVRMVATQFQSFVLFNQLLSLYVFQSIGLEGTDLTRY